MSKNKSSPESDCPQRNDTPPIICARDVAVAYQGNVAIFDVNMDVSPGEFVGICGPNGSGKTTLIKALLGILPILRGSINIFGKNLATTPKSEFHTRIGHVPQTMTVDPNFPARVYDVVMMGLYGQLGLLKWPNTANREAVEKAIEAVGIEAFQTRPFGHLSTGQQQKVLIARSLVHQPEILFLDEPTSSLDFKVGHTILELVGRLHKTRNLTTVLISHNIRDLRDFCTRIFCLDHRMIWAGPPKDPTLDRVLQQIFQIQL